MTTTTHRAAEQATERTAAETEEERRQRQIEANQETIRLLESWRNATEEEIQDQKETWELLKRALEEDPIAFREIHL